MIGLGSDKNIVILNIGILLAIRSKRNSSGGHLLSCCVGGDGRTEVSERLGALVFFV